MAYCTYSNKLKIWVGNATATPKRHSSPPPFVATQRRCVVASLMVVVV